MYLLKFHSDNTSVFLRHIFPLLCHYNHIFCIHQSESEVVADPKPSPILVPDVLIVR